MPKQMRDNFVIHEPKQNGLRQMFFIYQTCYILKFHYYPAEGEHYLIFQGQQAIIHEYGEKCYQRVLEYVKRS